MKFGIRKPSIKGRVKAKLSPKRYVRHSLGLKAPKGYGILTNPKKAIYNKIYNKTSFSVDKLFKTSKRKRTKEDDENTGVGILILIILVVGYMFWSQILIGLGIILGIVILYFVIKFFTNSNSSPTSNAINFITDGKYKEAIEELKPLSDKYNYEIYDLLAIANFSLKKHSEAIKYWNEIYNTLDKADDNKCLIANKLVAVYLTIGKIENANIIFKELSYRKRKINSDVYNIGLNISKALLSEKEDVKAEKILQRLLKIEIYGIDSPVNATTNEELKQETINIFEEKYQPITTAKTK